MASRELKDLVPELRKKANQVVEICKKNNVDILIYCTLRTLEDQAKLFRQGRSRVAINKKIEELNSKGYNFLSDIIKKVGPQNETKIVTNAAPGFSWHNYRKAFDAVPIVGGKAMWSNSHPSWIVYGDACLEVGLTWAGTWKTFKEYPHAQLDPGNPITSSTNPEDIKKYFIEHNLLMV